MVRIVSIVSVLVSSTLFIACSNAPDYSTEIGKQLFPRTGIRTGKFTVNEIDPALVRIPDCNGVCVYEYSVPLNRRLLSKGYLFESAQPDTTGRNAVILFGHWLGGVQNIDSSEREFFDEAVRYAMNGHVCAIPVGSYPWMTGPTGTEEDIQLTKQQVDEYRAALDLLWSRPGNRGRRALFIGHDYGAMFGILTAAADKRINALVVMAPVSRFWKWNRILKPVRGEDQMGKYQTALDPYDPVSLIGELEIPILFQYVQRDQFVDNKDTSDLYGAAKPAKAEIHWYSGTHALNRQEQAGQDRAIWVEARFSEWRQEKTR